MLYTELKKKGHCLRLTRSFYPKDEAEISLLLSIIKKEPCETCLFWACELIYSGFDIAPLLWSLYYDFYAQLNPGLFGRIATALGKLRDGDVEPVLMVIKTMRVKKATDNVFSLRISQTPTKFTIYRGRTPTWLAGYPAEQRPLLRAICNYDWNQIMLYINRRIGEPKELLKSVIKVMTEKQIVNAKDSSLETDDIVEAEWNNHGYEDEFHIVLSLIVSLITPDEQIDFNKKLIKLNESEKKYVAYLTSWDGDGKDSGNGDGDGSEPHVCPAGGSEAGLVGVISGGCGSEVEAIKAAGIDTFLTGEGPHWSYTAAEELGLNVLYGGHYATETFGVRAAVEMLGRVHATESVFIDHPTGL